jgi:hypothetical protein
VGNILKDKKLIDMPVVQATNLNWSTAPPPDQLARFRRWFTAFEAGRTGHAEELDSTATKLGRLAGRAFAELKKRAKEPRE